MTAPALEAAGVEKTYTGGVRALAGIDLAVAPGETLALVGESGSGKTTLLRMFNRMVEPTAGRILVRGRPTAAWDPIVLRRGVGYVQQDGGLLPHWTVERNVALVPELLGWPAEHRASRVRELLGLMSMDPGRFLRRYPVELSGGQRQRVALARALAADPDIVLLDEPFGALDAITRGELQQAFLAMKGVVGKTMLLVTHDIDEALLLADRIAVLRAGSLLQADTPDRLRTAPAHDYVRLLLSHGSAGAGERTR